MANRRIEELDHFADELEQCKSRGNKHVMQLLRRSMRDDETRQGVLPRSLKYYLKKGKPNLNRIRCVVGELRRIFVIYASNSALITSRR